MGADLLLLAWETGLRTKVDFQKAWKKLESAGDDDLASAFSRAIQADLNELVKMHGIEVEENSGCDCGVEDDPVAVRKAVAKVARGYAEDGLKTLELMWKGHHRAACVLDLKASRILIAGGTSWGDPPFDEHDEVAVACELGLMKAAGFWS